MPSAKRKLRGRSRSTGAPRAETPHCSFCASSTAEPGTLIAGSSAWICELCVAACQDTLRAQHQPSAGDADRDTTRGPRDIPQLLAAHFAADPSRLPVVEQEFAAHERPNLQLALDELLAGITGEVTLLGLVSADRYQPLSLAKLSRRASARGCETGPVEYVTVSLGGGDADVTCVKRGLYLVVAADTRLALLLADEECRPNAGVVVQAMAGDRSSAERLVRGLAHQTRLGRAYRGRALALERDCYGGLMVDVQPLPRVERSDIILPELVLRRIERHAIAFSRHRDRLRAARRHLTRGILLYGPPGTGKTLSALYVVASMPERTVLQLTGVGTGAIEAACRMARLLEPSTVLLEDVDLIGSEREEQSVGANALLFELLNQMDRLGAGADVLFVLTTNRPDVLEPALAARPGRVDQAIEIPLPDRDCRRRLFELYSRGLDVQIPDWSRAVEATAGVSASFIRELLRKAALLAAEASDAALVVREQHLDEATHELLVAGGPLTQRLVGGAASAPRANHPVK